MIMRVLAIVAASSLAASVLGQPAEWNRRMTGLAVYTDPASGLPQVHAAWSFSINDSDTAPRDLSTGMDLIVNGSPISSLIIPATVDGPIGDCGLGGCNGGCGNGTIDGLANDLFCHPEECDCGPRDLVASFPPSPLLTGDEIMVILYPAPGALPEPNMGDDSVSMASWDGEPVFWDRRIEAVSLIPDPSTPGRFDVEVTWSAGIAGISSRAILRTDIVVLVNGEPVGLEGGCLDWIVPNTGRPCSVNCDEPTCGDYFCGGSQNNALCRPFDSPSGGYCACATDSLNATISGISLQPEDEIMVILRPAPGALPPLPGFEDDDATVIPGPCPGDLNADGLIGLADLAQLLSNYGTTGGVSYWDGDLDGDGDVDLSDLAALLAIYGTTCP